MVNAQKVTPAVSELRRPGPAAFGMLFLVGFTFGMMFVFNRLATTHGVPFIPYVFLQALGGALILLIVGGAQNHLPDLSTQSLRFYLVTGVCNFSLPFSILSLVAPKVPSGILSLGLMLIPLMIYALALGLGMDRFRWIRLTGLLLGQTLYTAPAEIYRALIEATAFGALTIINRFEEYGVKVEQIVNCGGIAEKN